MAANNTLLYKCTWPYRHRLCPLSLKSPKMKVLYIDTSYLIRSEAGAFLMKLKAITHLIYAIKTCAANLLLRYTSCTECKLSQGLNLFNYTVNDTLNDTLNGHASFTRDMHPSQGTCILHKGHASFTRDMHPSQGTCILHKGHASFTRDMHPSQGTCILRRTPHNAPALMAPILKLSPELRTPTVSQHASVPADYQPGALPELKAISVPGLAPPSQNYPPGLRLGLHEPTGLARQSQ